MAFPDDQVYSGPKRERILSMELWGSGCTISMIQMHFLTIPGGFCAVCEGIEFPRVDAVVDPMGEDSEEVLPGRNIRLSDKPLLSPLLL